MKTNGDMPWADLKVAFEFTSDVSDFCAWADKAVLPLGWTLAGAVVSNGLGLATFQVAGSLKENDGKAVLYSMKRAGLS